MRQLATLPDERTARTFTDYLMTQGIESSADEAQSGWAVWVADDDDLERAKEELAAFLANPDDGRYRQAGKAAAAVRTGERKHQERRRRNFIDVRTHGYRMTQGRYPLTLILIVVCGIVAAVSRLGADYSLLRWLFIVPVVPAEQGIYAGNLAATLPWQAWRLVTPMFIHFGVLHLVFNLFWLRDLGSAIEIRRGTLFFGAMVVALAVLSNLAEYFWSGHPLFGGMSGVVYGMFGYVWMKSRYQPQDGLHVGPQTVAIMMIVLVLAMTGVVGNIANAAHVAGLVAGMTMGITPYAWRRLRRNRR